MSTAYYNGVVLNDVLTESIESTPEPDPSGADTLYVRLRFSLLATVIAGQGSTAHGVAAGATFVSSLRNALELLSVPKRRFRFDHAGEVFVDILPGAVPPGGGPTATKLSNMDVHHGPKPSVTVLGIPGTVSCRVRFVVECCVPSCTDSATGNGVLNLRFWIHEDVDLRTWTVRRKYSGRLRLAHANLNPHAFRNLCMPPVQPGFQPVDAEFAGSEDNLTLDFSITFQQLWAQAPAPATDWDGTHTVSSPMAGGAVGESELNLSLAAPTDVPQTQLLSLAAKILQAKLHFEDMTKDGSVFLLYSAFSASLKDNKIQANARIRHTGSQSLANITKTDFGVPLRLQGYNRNKATIGRYTATTAGLFIAALQSPCNPFRMPQTRDTTADKPTSVVNEETTTVSDGQLTSYGQNYSTSHQINAYLSYKESNYYDFDEGRISLPISATSVTGSSKPTSLLINLYPAQAVRVIKIQASRLNAWPELPAQQDFVDHNGIGHALIATKPTPHAVQLSGDGIKTLHTVDYELTYALSRRPKPTESLSAGRIPMRNKVSNEGEKSKMPATVYIPFAADGGII